MKPWRIGFEAEGLNLDRLARQAGEQGIVLEKLTHPRARCMRGLVREDDLPGLLHLCNRGGWRMVTGERRGLGRAAERMRRRWIVLPVAGLCLAALLLASMLVWRVEIEGAGSYLGDIRAFLQEEGIAPVMRKRDISIDRLRQRLEWRYPRVAWIECGFRGMTLSIRVHEGMLPGDPLSLDGQMDVVAARSGVIDRIITVAGTPLVKAGDVVKTGDVLIRGEERTHDGALRPVAARGEVTARVWDGARVRMPLYETRTVYTGRTETADHLSLPWFSLTRVPECSFAQADVRTERVAVGGLFVPVVLIRETRLEAEITPQLRDMAQLRAEASACAMRKLYQSIQTKDKLIDKWVECSIIENEDIEAFAVAMRCVDIGVRQKTQQPHEAGQP